MLQIFILIINTRHLKLRFVTCRNQAWGAAPVPLPVYTPQTRPSCCLFHIVLVFDTSFMFSSEHLDYNIVKSYYFFLSNDTITKVHTQRVWVLLPTLVAGQWFYWPVNGLQRLWILPVMEYSGWLLYVEGKKLNSLLFKGHFWHWKKTKKSSQSQ